MAKRSWDKKSIEVILLQADKHLGEKHEIIKVKPIYARNVLLPKKIAILADASNKNAYAQKIKSWEADRAKKATNLEELFMKIHAEWGITLIKKANKEHGLYEKVDEKEIADKIKEIHGIEVEPHLFKLKKKIVKLGQYTVPFLYKELKKEIIVKVEQDAEEAKKQKKWEETAVPGEELDLTPKKTKEEIRAEKEAQRAKDKIETIKKLKEKYK